MSEGSYFSYANHVRQIGNYKRCMTKTAPAKKKNTMAFKIINKMLVSKPGPGEIDKKSNSCSKTALSGDCSKTTTAEMIAKPTAVKQTIAATTATEIVCNAVVGVPAKPASVSLLAKPIPMNNKMKSILLKPTTSAKPTIAAESTGEAAIVISSSSEAVSGDCSKTAISGECSKTAAVGNSGDKDKAAGNRKASYSLYL